MIKIIFKALGIDSLNDNLLIKLLYKSKLVLVYAILFGLVSNLLMLAMSVYSLQVLDRVISSGSYETLVMLTLVVVVSIIAMVAINGARTNMLRGMSVWLGDKLSEAIFIRSIYFSLQTRGAPTSTFFRDLETIKSFISGQGLTTIIDAPWAIIFLITIFFLHPYQGLITVIGAFLLISIAIISEKSTKKMYENANESFIKSMQQMDIVSRNAEAVAAMGMIGNLYSFWDKQNFAASEVKEEATGISSMLSNLTKFFRYLVQIAITCMGAILVLKGELTSGGMIAGSILVGRALAPFETMVAMWKNVIGTRKSFEKLKSFLDAKPYIGQDIRLPEPKGLIMADKLVYAVNFKNTQRPVIKGVSFAINPGEIIAIIGDSAAGKSTLARLITGIIQPSSGAITLDGADIFKWSRSPEEVSISQYIGYLPQNIELFNGTVKSNIARMDEDLDEAKVIKAAQMAEVHELILKLPDGYDTSIGIDGATLSGGQKQRIALARAFYGSPKLIVLDEPNANLDQAGEAALFKAIQNAKSQGITTIVISHRFSVLNSVDRVMILRDGMILDFDDKDKIIAKISAKPGPKP